MSQDINLQKIEILKKGIFDSRKKVSDLESQIVKLKEDIVMKEEIINKQKEELKKFHESSKQPLKSFITGFFENKENEEEEDDNDDEHLKDDKYEKMNYIKKENKEFKEQIKFLQDEKENLNTKLSESEKIISKLKSENLNFAEILQVKLKNENDIDNIKEKYEKQISELKEKYEKQIAEIKTDNLNKNQMINELTKSNKIMTELYKSFDIQKFEYEKTISTQKKDVEKYKDIHDSTIKQNELIKEQLENLSKKSQEDQDEISKLNDEIYQYKLIIEELTPISKNSVISGTFIPPEKNGNNKHIEISFGKYQNSLSIKEQDEKEKIYINKEIVNIVRDNKDENKIWIVVKQKNVQKTYLCQFSKKEVKYILKFYKEIKIKPNNVENALINASLGDYFY